MVEGGRNNNAVFLIIAALLVLFMYYYYLPSEGFATKQEKAETIFRWWLDHPRATYAKYRDDLGGQSNIVEYEDVRGLVIDRKLTLDAVMKIV